ncbi:MAG: uroporphyrinogen-III C-methyltransferase [Acidobacteria bacterium]|nr:uroporphyrinogen-III C-methyltransferase [Acidobacteriota bacterium]
MSQTHGKVFLVGAGPGDPELLTLKAARLLRSADVVLHDELFGREILSFIPRTAEVRNVGKRCGRKSPSQEEINQLLVNYALLGLQVVRLKGGDPLVFGRGGEEMEALRRANIDFEIVPGVTSALAAGAAAQIPLTHRQAASSLLILSGHHAKSAPSTDWPASIPAQTTVLVYMPGHNYAATAEKLMNSGVAGKTPCALISQASSREQKSHISTVTELRNAPRLPSPTLLVVGDVVAWAGRNTAAQAEAWLESLSAAGPGALPELVAQNLEERPE